MQAISISPNPVVAARPQADSSASGGIASPSPGESSFGQLFAKQVRAQSIATAPGGRAAPAKSGNATSSFNAAVQAAQGAVVSNAPARSANRASKNVQKSVTGESLQGGNAANTASVPNDASPPVAVEVNANIPVPLEIDTTAPLQPTLPAAEQEFATNAGTQIAGQEGAAAAGGDTSATTPSTQNAATQESALTALASTNAARGPMVETANATAAQQSLVILGSPTAAGNVPTPASNIMAPMSQPATAAQSTTQENAAANLVAPDKSVAASGPLLAIPVVASANTGTPPVAATPQEQAPAVGKAVRQASSNTDGTTNSQKAQMDLMNAAQADSLRATATLQNATASAKPLSKGEARPAPPTAANAHTAASSAQKAATSEPNNPPQSDAESNAEEAQANSAATANAASTKASPVSSI